MVGSLFEIDRKPKLQDFTITVVDSGSDDLTIKICENRNVRVMNLTPFLPGKAINRGLESEGGATYGVILSAHCVPTNKDWLGSFVSFMDNNLACAAHLDCSHQ